MKHIITRGAFAAAVLAVLCTSGQLAAQDRGTPMSAMKMDSTCMAEARPLGDSSRAGQVQTKTDSMGINKPTASKNCVQHASMPSDSSCMAMGADSSTYLKGDKASAPSTGAPGKMRSGATRPNCSMPMGAGVGNDTTRWPTRADSTHIRKP